MIKYQVIPSSDTLYQVIEIKTIFGERLDAYESEPNTVVKQIVYEGTPSDVYAFLKLKEGRYL